MMLHVRIREVVQNVSFKKGEAKNYFWLVLRCLIYHWDRREL